MQVLIRIKDEEYKKISNENPSYADDFPTYYAIKNGTSIPDNATNGEVIKAMFPNWEIKYVRKMSGLNRYDIEIDELNSLSFYEDWWNSPYKADIKRER